LLRRIAGIDLRWSTDETVAQHCCVDITNAETVMAGISLLNGSFRDRHGLRENCSGRQKERRSAGRSRQHDLAAIECQLAHGHFPSDVPANAVETFSSRLQARRARCISLFFETTGD